MLVQGDRSSTEPDADLLRASNRPKSSALTAVRIPKNIDVLLCELCQGGHHEDQILLCDHCDRGFHMFCLNPPLDKVPAGDWACPLCLQARSGPSAMRPGSDMSWGEFEKLAAATKRMYWGGDARARKVSAAGSGCFHASAGRCARDARGRVDFMASAKLAGPM
eukprot:GHUV01037819.1.p1 GENE.GHUV01037819.1~~GHUV01037819.1.p1  ORF type:complete len:164 (-),score=9.90 GHUV01037819.1:2-493(-)